MKPTVTWVLVADGGQGRVFENRGPGKGLHPVSDLDFSTPRLKAQDIVTDRPGRSYSSVGHGRSAIESSTDPVEQQEEEFVTSLARVLDEKLGEGSYDRLVIAAAPTALGYIRPALSASVRKVLAGELHKDLTNTPFADLPKHFDTILAA